jgi:hypothetical protein
MAAAAVELAERCQRRRRGDRKLHLLVAIALILVGAPLAILAAADGDALLMSAMALITLTNAAQLAFNPVLRPRSVARSLEASRRVSIARS